LKFKGDVVSPGPLLLNRLVCAAAAPLQCEINACRRLLDNDTKSEALRHIEKLIKAPRGDLA